MTAPMKKRFDVLGYGCVAVDDLVYVDSYPPVDSKTHVRRRERQGGGLVGTALVAAARLGARCAYAAALGEDDLSAFVRQRFRTEGIDVSHVARVDGARPIHSVIVVGEDRGSRNIFADLSGLRGVAVRKSLVHSAKVLLVDHFWGDQKIRAASWARQAAIPIVADLEDDTAPGFRDLLALVDHPILPLDFGRKITARRSPRDVAAKLWNARRKVVVLTDGGRGCWYLTGADARQMKHLPAFKVKVVDTTGCGDVFHGAYAAGLAEGLDVEVRLRLAAATAAIKATCPGGQTGIPRRRQVEAFLRANQL